MGKNSYKVPVRRTLVAIYLEMEHPASVSQETIRVVVETIYHYGTVKETLEDGVHPYELVCSWVDMVEVPLDRWENVNGGK